VQAYEPEVHAPADSMPNHRRTAVKWIVPAACVTYGVIARFDKMSLRSFDLRIAKQVDKHVKKHYVFDDYLQYAPAVFAFGLDFVPGLRAEHNLRDRTLLLATSYAFTGIVIYNMKHAISVRRPDGSASNSFPSGHTAVAFTGAHLLYREYREQSPWIGVGGYAMAATVSVMRVINKKHWMSDVIAGAGIGILSVEAAGMMLPVWRRLLGPGEARISIMPVASGRDVGIRLVYIF
jgi:membrane-associated phospholipid phosphatase